MTGMKSARVTAPHDRAKAIFWQPTADSNVSFSAQRIILSENFTPGRPEAGQFWYNPLILLAGTERACSRRCNFCTATNEDDMRTRLLSATGAAALLAFSQPVHANTLIASIYGEYDTGGPGDLPASVNGLPCTGNCSSAYDTPTLFFSNVSGYNIINAQMQLSVAPAQNSGWNTLNNGATQTVSLGTLANGFNTQVSWYGSGPLFNNDYDDSYGGNYGNNPFPGTTPGTQNPGSFAVNCTLNAAGLHPEWTNFCAPTGNFLVKFSGTLSGAGALNGQSVASVFGEYDVNGVYTGWQGLDPLGWSENALYDVHSGTVGGVLANIYLGTTATVPTNPTTSAPEPASLSVLAGGLGALALTRRRRKPQA